ncbi:MAG: hypothetical protein JO128_25215, partial [Alphaproteobacteria bacterium]|nr:hypothetical protein [Alphaproteobacteria bacterium]
MSAHSATSPLRSVSQRWLRVGLIAFATLLIVGYAADTWRVLQAKRADAIEQALGNADALLLSLEEHLVRTSDAADLIVSAAADQVEAARASAVFDPAKLHQALAALAARAPELRSISYVDKNGRITAHSETTEPLPLDLSNRSYFQHHRDDPSPEIYLAPPRLATSGGELFIPLTRRVNEPDGRFFGVIVGMLAPGYFEGFYSRLQDRTPGTLAILSEAGVLLAQIPRAPELNGQSQAGTVLFTNLLRTSSAGSAHVAA